MDDLAIPQRDPQREGLQREHLHRFVPQGDYWRGDLLRAMLLFESSQRDFVSFALQRGYDYEPIATIKEPIVQSSTKFPTKEQVEEKGTDSPSAIPPVSEHLWVPMRYLVDRFVPETPIGIHGLDKTKNKDVALITYSQIQQPQVKYLAAWPELRNRLEPVLGIPKRTRRLDTEVLIKRISRGDPIRKIPFYHRRHSHDQITVIREHALHCAPYRLDQEMVVKHLSQATVRGGLNVLDAFFPCGLSNPASDDSSTIIRTRETEPAPGSQVLILGDLGLLLKIKDTFDQDALEWWYRACRRWSSRGCKLFALVPFGAERVPARLRGWIEPIAWQGDAVKRLSDPQQEQAVNELLTMAYPAQQIEPGLLRELRRLIPGLEDASLEARFWQDGRHTGPRYDAVQQTEASTRKSLKLDFEQLDEVTITEILRQIRNYRLARGFSVLWQMELMNLPMRLRDLIDPNRAEQDLAIQTYQAMCVQMSEGGTYGLKDRLMSLSIHASEHAMDDANIGSAVRTIRNRYLPDAKRSEKTRLIELPPSIESRNVQIECNPTGIRFLEVGISPLNSIASGSSHCVTISSGKPILELYGPVGSIENPIKSFWKSGKKPDWVSAFGSDEYGLWCEFQVPLHDGDGVVTQRMRWIKPGTFMMGSHASTKKLWWGDETQHEVTLTRGFWIADTPCTQGLWMGVGVSKNPSRFQGFNNPVERVSWEYCEAWLKRLGDIHPQMQAALPSEAQWEYACRAGSTGAYCFGDSEEELEEYAWYEKNSDLTTHPVGRKLPNAWGLFDMHGNVWEWCEDYYGEYTRTRAIDPSAPSYGASRVIRGGSWDDPARSLRSACRVWFDPGHRISHLGFRLLSSALGSEPNEGAMLPEAEPGTERARIGSGELEYGFLQSIDLDAVGETTPEDQFSEIAVNAYTSIRVVSDQEGYQFDRLEKPDWAVDFGHDAYGLYSVFEVEPSKKGIPIRQRMRWIPPGRFLMGSPEGKDYGRGNEDPQHEVVITHGYWMFDTPCTQALWRALMGENPSYFEDPDRPVEQVSWEDACGFAEKLNQWFAERNSKKRGKKVLGWNELWFRLPTESEWEYACRAGTTGDTYSGDLKIAARDQTKSEVLNSIAWYGGNCGREYDLRTSMELSWLSDLDAQEKRGGTRKVATKAPNPWGLYDMLGNVWEWCEDWYGQYTADRATDPTGPSMGTSRVVRGGGWVTPARYLRSACRFWFDPGLGLNYLGFRLLSSAHQAKPTESGERASRSEQREEAEGRGR